MKLQPLKQTPALIAAVVILLVSIVAVSRVDFFERLEHMTYDWRARTALHFPSQVSTNLGFALVDDETIDAVKSGELGYRFGLYWPRHVYGRLINELSAQGADVIAFDVLFGERREDHAPLMIDGNLIESVEYFTNALRSAGNISLATTVDLTPPDFFATNAAAVGHVSTEKDSDGILRRAKAFTQERVWHLGIVLAARHLKLDLEHADVDLAHGRITLRGEGGIERIIPVDADGFFYVDWALRPDDPRLTVEPVHSLLRQNRLRKLGESFEPLVDWRGKLVVVGSSAQGNDLTDLGATPLDKNTLLVSKHWNVANSVLTGRFIHPATIPLQIVLIVLLGVMTALLSLKMRVVPGLLAVLMLATIYSALCVGVFVQQRLWLPMILPLSGALFVQYALLVTYRALFEQREQRRVKAIFSKVVSPNVAKELLGREYLLLGGVRCELTVLFADVRGFTELTDTAQEQVAEYVRANKLNAEAAEVAINDSARETLDTVNTYLALVADTVKKHDGTLDKYIGDCVMAFWGAPTAQPQHALNCVRAAIDSQQALHTLNQRRVAENSQREIENKARVSAGLHPKPMLAILSLGTGINTGSVTAGLMGSADHIFNYTVFGREVNLASRLEGVSGRGRIIIGEATYAALLRDDPALAARCIEQEPTKPKGFQKPVRNFEVPWQT